MFNAQLIMQNAIMLSAPVYKYTVLYTHLQSGLTGSLLQHSLSTMQFVLGAPGENMLSCEYCVLKFTILGICSKI